MRRRGLERSTRVGLPARTPAKALPQLIPKRVIRACAFRARGVVIRHETIRTTEIIVAGHD